MAELDQSGGAVEYTDCISPEGQHPLHSKCTVYDILLSDGRAQVLEIWGM